MHRADKAVLRLAIGLGLAVLIAYGLALELPFAVCLVAVLLLCKPGSPIPFVRGAVLINEIMSDPAPAVLLPEAEFIEIVNTSTLPYDMGGWTLSDGTTTIALPQIIIRPAEFLILTSTTNELKFADSVRVAGVPGFPSLNNTGEPLALRTDSLLIDSVSYDIHWFGEDSRQDGGWTLERLPAVDRAILRVAVWELLHAEDVPEPVAVDEAVELAKHLSTDDSPGFVNGVLGQVMLVTPQIRAASAAIQGGSENS